MSMLIQVCNTNKPLYYYICSHVCESRVCQRITKKKKITPPVWSLWPSINRGSTQIREILLFSFVSILILLYLPVNQDKEWHLEVKCTWSVTRYKRLRLGSIHAEFIGNSIVPWGHFNETVSLDLNIAALVGDFYSKEFHSSTRMSPYSQFNAVLVTGWPKRGT